LTIADLIIITGEFLALATVVGNPFRVLLLRAWEFGPHTILEVKWLTSLTTGIAVLPLFLLWLGLLPGLVTPAVMWVLPFAFLGANIWIYRKQLLRLPTSTWRFKEVRRAKSWWFVGLFVFILVFQMIALPGLFVTPGDDAKLYSLITQRFVEAQGIPGDWGTYAATSWYIERTHLLLPGFPSLVAFLVPLTGFDIPTVVSVLASVFRMLTASTLYVLIWTLTRRRVPSLLAMSVYGLLILEPTVRWFSWGGMAELSSLSLLPVAAAGTFLVAKNGITSKPGLFWVSLLVAGMSLLHPFAFFYYLAFVISNTTVFLFKADRSKAIFSLLPTVLGLGLASGPILHAVPAEASIAASYSVSNPAWTPVLNWTMTIGEALVGLFDRSIIVYGAAAIILLLGGTILLRQSVRTQEEIFVVLALWVGVLFFLHENNPPGLFLIPFPLWYRIDSNRTLSITSLAVSIIASLLLESEFRRIVRGNRHVGFLPYLSLTRRRLMSRGRGLAILIGVLMVTTQLVSNASLLLAARVDSPISADDMQAFSWIRTQTSPNATFFVNWADAGTWIPVYAGRRVVLPFGVVTDIALMRNYTSTVSFFAGNPTNATSLQFMNFSKATYVYSGPARIYGRPGFNSTKIIAAGLFDQLYHQGSVWIFRLGQKS